ncbi:MAG TPA: iron-containing alcohol dehydrogenase, partial [Solirubrobacteraceae bacterium]|nr:iron-containing alcohol dehydrogenase [Solirubrobacteraceae bacterium]
PGGVAPLIGGAAPDPATALPVIAVPTTAGSGAEVTRGAIVTDVVRHAKEGVRGDAVFPRVAVIDPELTATLPPAVAAETAFDALTHVVEGYVARKASPLTRALSEEALRILAAHLPELAAGTATARTRERLAFAALLGGLNVANASTCLPHRLQQAMGAVPRVTLAHARGLAALYPAWLELATPHAPDAFARVGAALGDGDARAAIARHREALGLTATLADAGFRTEDLGVLVGAVAGNVANDPTPEVTRETIRELYRASLQPTP